MDENKKVIRKPIMLNRNEPIIENKQDNIVIDEKKPVLNDPIESNISMKKVTKSNPSPTFITCLLSVLLIATYLLVPKLYEPAKNIVFNASITAYPFTFLLIVLAARKYTFKELRKSVITSTIIFILFLIIMCIGIMPAANSDTMSYNVVIQYLFGLNSFQIGDYSIFYPELNLVLGIAVAYFIGHLLYLFIYNALSTPSNEGMVVMLSLFISYIIDRTIFMPIYYSRVLTQDNSFAYFVKNLTGEYVASILVVITLILVFLIFSIFGRKKS